MSWYDHERDERKERAKSYCQILPAIEEERSASRAMDEYLTARRLSYSLARDNGWYPSYHAGDQHLRIVIPATSKLPSNRYWQARAIDPTVNPRYQSPRASRGDAVVTVYPRGGTGRRPSGVVVEGPMDALAAAEAGCIGVALMGVMPPEAALGLTATLLSGTMTFLVFDRDQPGPTVTRTMPFLIQRGVKVKLVDPYPSKDLAAMDRTHRVELLS